MKKKLSEFQSSVLKAVRKIPFAEVKTYKWVAEKIGKPKSFRAVGQALKNNPFPFVIPCHRVIKSDGSIGGYVFGVNFKKELLMFEREILETTGS